jgi:TolA-binding protein
MWMTRSRVMGAPATLKLNRVQYQEVDEGQALQSIATQLGRMKERIDDLEDLVRSIYDVVKIEQDNIKALDERTRESAPRAARPPDALSPDNAYRVH